MTTENSNVPKSTSSEKAPEDPINIGLIMPLAPIPSYPPAQFDDVREIIKDTIDSIEDFHFKVSMVSDSDEVSIIQKIIVQNIYDYPLVIVDVSGKNPNVMFELGMRLAFDMPIVLIKDEKTDYSFDTAPLKTIGYRSDLRHPNILKFKSDLRSAILSTYKKSLKDPSYSPYLSSFGDIKVKEISSSSVNTTEALTQILSQMDKMSDKQLTIEEMMQGNYRQEAIDGLQKYYKSLFSDDFDKWNNISLEDSKSDSYKEWLLVTRQFILKNFPHSKIPVTAAIDVFNEVSKNALPF